MESFERVFSGQKGKDRCVDGIEHLCGEGADIIKVLTGCQYDIGRRSATRRTELNRVDCFRVYRRGVCLACKFGCECHNRVSESPLVTSKL